MENYKSGELYNLIGNKNIINCIKARRLSWIGHAYRLTNDKGEKIIWVEIDIYKIGRKTKIRWEDDMQEGLRIMKINNWTECVQDRVNL